MKKKIVILSLTLGYGGIEKYISSLCKMFKGKYDVKIICNYKEVDKPAFDFYDAEIEYLSNGSFRNLSIKKLVKKLQIIGIIKELYNRFKNTIKEKRSMNKKIKELDCDVVITTRLKHNRLVNKLLKNSNILKIATEHNSYDIWKKYDKQIANSVSNFDYFVLVSKIQYEHYKKMLNNCVYIPNVIDIISKEKSKLNTNNIISVGRFSEEKGFLDLVKVMKEVVKKDNKIKLYLIGDGYQKKEISNLIKDYHLKDNIILPGFIKQEELASYYLKSSLYVMTSLSEAFGIVLLESMSYNVPCIAFDSAKGANIILKEANFPLIENRDINKMADLILTLINDKKRLKKLSENCKVVENYSITNIEKHWDKLLK